MASNSPSSRATARLFAILARESPLAVIFRRGPSKQVLLIAWDRRDDSFQYGQWLKGRIYEDRGDLSPDGTRLIYFAANQRPPMYSWTAVSRPPYLTALALWPKGDTWGGGGLFSSNDSILLNHESHRLSLADSHRLPPGIKVAQLGAPVVGKNYTPIYDRRLTRDGWTLVDEGMSRTHSIDSPVWVEFTRPMVYERPCPVHRRQSISLTMRLMAIKERNGPWQVHEYDVTGEAGDNPEPLGRLDWADWDSNGDILFARSGRLFRLKPAGAGKNFRYRKSAAIEIGDFRNLTFEAREAPVEALAW